MEHHSAPLEDCDVYDKERLAVYRYFRRRWIDILNGNDDHAISKQITALLDADLKFRTINYARQLCEAAGVVQNGMVHSFINRGFIAHQAFAVRRVTEEYNGQKRNAVYSLPRVISEIEDQSHLITREMYVCADGDPYDAGSEIGHSVIRHESFDELSQTEHDKRTRDDRIHRDSFRALRSRLDSSNVIRTYANKLLAHAADPDTRSGNEGFNFADLDNAYSDLIWLTNRLSTHFLYSSSHVFLPAYTFDMLESIDNALCPTVKLQELAEFWSERYKELEEIEREDDM